MTNGAVQSTGEPAGDRPGASEPITLTDPDGAVTRMDPWSSWTREQVRAPGGEPALVTRLEQGQLWFAAGRTRSPWRHEVKVGPATVSTPRGRFHATAEPDGGATIACLAGRTRVVAGLREPVLLGPDQTASVSSDGATLVVMDRSIDVGAPEPAEPGDGPIALPADRPSSAAGRPGVEEALEAEIAAAARTAAGSSRLSGRRAGDVAAVASSASAVAEGDAGDPADAGDVRDAGPGGGSGGDGPGGDGNGRGEEPMRHPRRRTSIPEIVAVAALLAVLIAAVIVFGRDPQAGDIAATPDRTSSSVVHSSTTAAPTTTGAPTTTAAPTSTVPPAPTSPPALSGSGTASGVLTACKRADGGVRATIEVSHRSGGTDRFVVRVGLVDPTGGLFAEGQAQSGVLGQGDRAAVDVLVPVAGRASGACELLGVASA